jgi:hypothetical protein
LILRKLSLACLTFDDLKEKSSKTTREFSGKSLKWSSSTVKSEAKNVIRSTFSKSECSAV